MDGEIMEQVKWKNYALVVLLFIVTVVAILFVKKIYEDRESARIITNDRLDVLYEIKEDDLKNYVVENRRIILYTSNSLDDSLKEFEESFRNYIVKNEISKEIVYLNLNQISSRFYTNLSEKYSAQELKQVKFPQNQANIYVLEDGKITDVLYKDYISISLEDVILFLNRVIQE